MITFFDRIPNLLSEFDSSKNTGLMPEELAANSKELVWWQCPVKPSHSWQAKVKSRVDNKSGCPFCTGNRVEPEKSLAALYPHIVHTDEDETMILQN